MKHLNSIIFLLLFCTGMKAQSVSADVIASAGNYFSSGGTSLSWTIGESVIETFSTSTAHLTQGFQQPVLVVSGMDEADEVRINIFPNPTTGIINFETGNTIEITSVNIHSLQGQLVSSFAMQENSCDISSLPAGVYLLQIKTTQSVITYRLIKN